MDQAIADTSFLLSRFFSYPDEAFSAAVCSGEAAGQIVSALAELPGWANLPQERRLRVEEAAEALGRRYAGTPAEDAFHDMRVEYTMLLAGMPKPIVQPYESVFRGQAEGKRVLLMVDDVAEQVRASYKRSGVVALNPSEPVDHVSTELEFLGLLASRGDVDDFQAFFEAHCKSWMPAFAEELWNASSEGCHLRLAAASLASFAKCMTRHPDTGNACS